jgi:hypothetical protein
MTAIMVNPVFGKRDVGLLGLLDPIATDRPVQVPVVEGQNARGLRIAIARSASSRGLSVKTADGDGFVAVRKIDAPRTRKGKQAPSTEGQRRWGRSPKRQEQDAGESASLQVPTARESESCPTALDHECLVPESG